MADQKSCCCARGMNKAIVVLVLLLVVGLAIVVKKRPQDPGRSKQPPGTVGGTPSQAVTKEFPPDTVLATVNGEDIAVQDVEDALKGLPAQYRSDYERQKHEFLEELITRKLLLQEARRSKIAETEAYRTALGEHEAHPGHEEHVLIDVLVRREVLDKVKVTDAELRSFYEERKVELRGEPSFENVKDLLRPSVEQQKRREAVESYVRCLRDKAAIVRNAEWIEKQKARAADNPLDRALKTKRPVVADFGRGKCIPCKMMKPILDDLKQKYLGKAEILIIEVDEYPALTRRCGIRAIPTQIFYDASGKEVHRHQGFMAREDIVEQLAKLGVR